MRVFLASIITMIAAPNLSAGSATAQPQYRVGIVQIVEHPALDASRSGILDAIKQAGMEKDIEIHYLNAQGSMVTGAQIAKKLLGEKPNAIVALGTPVAQAVMNGNRNIPVLFSAITDPVGAGLVKSLDAPGTIATGTTDSVPLGQQLNLILTIKPDLKRLAIIYNPGEANSLALVKQFRAECARLKITPIEATVNNTGQVLSAAKALVGRADGIFVGPDNTVASAFESILKVAIEAHVPIFSSDEGNVSKGALSAYSIDYFELGRLTGQSLIAVLKGKKPESIPVKRIERNFLLINKKYAAKMGISFNEPLLKSAHRVIE